MDKEDLRYIPHCGRCHTVVPADTIRCECGSRLILGTTDKHSRTFDLFTPFTLEGEKFDTKAQWEAHRQKIADIHCVSPSDVVLQDNSLRDRERRYEESQHARYEKLSRQR